MNTFGLEPMRWLVFKNVDGRGEVGGGGGRKEGGLLEGWDESDGNTANVRGEEGGGDKTEEVGRGQNGGEWKKKSGVDTETVSSIFFFWRAGEWGGRRGGGRRENGENKITSLGENRSTPVSFLRLGLMILISGNDTLCRQAKKKGRKKKKKRKGRANESKK